MCDSADWLTQLLILFSIFQSRMTTLYGLRKQLKLNKHPDTEAKDLSEHPGTYVNKAGYFLISVKVADERLVMSFQNRKDEEFELRHYEFDTSCWLQPRHELVKGARNVLQPAQYHLIQFPVEKAAKLID